MGPVGGPPRRSVRPFLVDAARAAASPLRCAPCTVAGCSEPFRVLRPPAASVPRHRLGQKVLPKSARASRRLSQSE